MGARRKPKPANENYMPEEEIFARLDLVRPVMTTMRAVCIPETVAQRTMTYLLTQLDKETGAQVAKTALVLGGASSVWDDAAEALHLFRPDAIAAVNDIGTRWAGRLDIWATLHPEHFVKWAPARAANGFTPARTHIAHEDGWRVDSIEDYRWPGMNASGSSGLYAVKVLMDRGFDRIVLAGVPMQASGAHFFNTSVWNEVSAFTSAWLDQRFRLLGVVKSMSGWTRESLGAPDADWLGAAALQRADTRPPPQRPL